MFNGKIFTSYVFKWWYGVRLIVAAFYLNVFFSHESIIFGINCIKAIWDVVWDVANFFTFQAVRSFWCLNLIFFFFKWSQLIYALVGLFLQEQFYLQSANNTINSCVNVLVVMKQSKKKTIIPLPVCIFLHLILMSNSSSSCYSPHDADVVV